MNHLAYAGNVNGYGQFCAVARSLDVLGERWTLLVVRELMLGARTYGDIRRGLPRIPKATLATRLRALQRAGLVDADRDGYQLTQAGTALAPVLRELAVWATETRAAPLTDDALDPVALTWDMQRRVNRAALPNRLVVVAVHFTDREPGASWFWLHLAPTGVNLCREDTGAPVDLWLSGPAVAITRWWLGEVSWTQLMRRPDVTLDGNRELRRQLQSWFLRYVFAPEHLARSAG